MVVLVDEEREPLRTPLSIAFLSFLEKIFSFFSCLKGFLHYLPVCRFNVKPWGNME